LYKGVRIRLSLFISHTNPELYKTESNIKNILCAKNINTKIIECSEINYKNYETISNSECSYDSSVKTKFLFSYPLTDDGDENKLDCDYKSFGDEYLYCCGEINYIKCKRLDKEWNSLYLFYFIS
jgi:hypothetical protein